MTHHHYTEEEREWLRVNCANATSFRDLTDRFNKQFGWVLKIETIRDYCHKRLKIKNSRGAALTAYKKGCNGRRLPIGTIRKSQTCTYIKVMESGKQMSAYSLPDWVPYQKYLWEQAYGKIKNDEYVCFLDGDTDNFALSNLAVINRKISARLAKRGWYTENAEVTKTGIIFCKLESEIKNKEREKNA